MAHAWTLDNASAGWTRGVIRVGRHVAGKDVSFVLIAVLESPLCCGGGAGGGGSHASCLKSLLFRSCPSVFVYTSHPPVRSHTRLDRYSSSYSTKYRNSNTANTAALNIASPRPALNPLTEIGQCLADTAPCTATSKQHLIRFHSSLFILLLLSRHGK
jgi:hypothetical protein